MYLNSGWEYCGYGLIDPRDSSPLPNSKVSGSPTLSPTTPVNLELPVKLLRLNHSPAQSTQYEDEEEEQREYDSQQEEQDEQEQFFAQLVEARATEEASATTPVAFPLLPSVGTWLMDKPPPTEVKEAPKAAAVTTEVATFAKRPSVGTWLMTALKKSSEEHKVPSPATEFVPFSKRPSVGTWLNSAPKKKGDVRSMPCEWQRIYGRFEAEEPKKQAPTVQEQVTAASFEDLDTNKDGEITREEFQDFVQKAAAVAEDIITPREQGAPKKKKNKKERRAAQEAERNLPDEQTDAGLEEREAPQKQKAPVFKKSGKKSRREKAAAAAAAEEAKEKEKLRQEQRKKAEEAKEKQKEADRERNQQQERQFWEDIWKKWKKQRGQRTHAQPQPPKKGNFVFGASSW